MTKNFYRSRHNRVIAGVYGGLAEYFEIDSRLMRIFGFTLLLLGIIPGVVSYILVWSMVPREPRVPKAAQPIKKTKKRSRS